MHLRNTAVARVLASALQAPTPWFTDAFRLEEFAARRIELMSTSSAS